MAEIATKVALVVAGIERLRDSFDNEDPLRHAKADLRRAAENTLAIAVGQAELLLRAASDLQLNWDDAHNPKDQP